MVADGKQYWIETLGCPKNQVDSDKLGGRVEKQGYTLASSPAEADLVVVNTCAFIEEARQESVNTILAVESVLGEGAELVVTGCMAERYGQELADALPEVDRVAPFGVPVTLGPTRSRTVDAAGFDLLELPRPASRAPWAYVKIAEGCDRNCGFCAIPSFRGKQRSRSVESILAEVESLQAKEIVLVAQDLASYGRDQALRSDPADDTEQGPGSFSDPWPIIDLVARVADGVDWVRLLYLYPSDLSPALIDAIIETGVPYFDLSLQHVSRPLLRRMRRWGDGDRFLERIETIRSLAADATFRSNFIVGYPGETEDDHDQLLQFVADARLDWCGFFSYSEEPGTYGAELDGTVPAGLIAERLDELTALQDRITAERRVSLIGTTRRVLIDEPGVARSSGEAPEIDGIIKVPEDLPVGCFTTVEIVDAEGPDLLARHAPEGRP